MKTMYLDCTNGVDEYALLKVLTEYLQNQFDVLPVLNRVFRVTDNHTDVAAWINDCEVDEVVKNDMRAVVHNLTAAGISVGPKNWVLIGSVCYLFRQLHMEQILASRIGVLPGTQYATAKLLEGAKIQLSYDGKGCSYLAAALLKQFVDDFGDMPGMRLEKVVHADTIDGREVEAYIGESEVSLFMNELVCNLDDMTPEELAYVEDAIGHEKNIVAICQDIAKNLQDQSLVSFMENEIQKHNETKEKLMHMLEVKANE